MVFAIAVLGGLAPAAFAEQPASTSLAARAAFGVYLGLVMTHFVVDAGVWRLREDFGRTLIGSRLPYLVRG